MLKQEDLNELYKIYREKFKDKEIVLGDGNIESKILLVGEAPGKDEVRLSRPFVGMAGKNLDEFIGLLDIRREDIFITNAIKYRLSRLNDITERIVNRPTKESDIRESREYLLREILIINPKIIVTLGNVPLKTIMDKSFVSIGECHGKLYETVIYNNKYNIFPLYHPASIIYNRSLKDVYIGDVLKLKENMNV